MTTTYKGFLLVIHSDVALVEVKKNGKDVKDFFTEKDAKRWIDRNN